MLARVIVEEAARRDWPLPPAERRARAAGPRRGVHAGRPRHSRRQCRLSRRARHPGAERSARRGRPHRRHRRAGGRRRPRWPARSCCATACATGINEAVDDLQAMDITYQVMLTGDRRRAAEVIARESGIPNVEAELLPEQKLDRVRQLGLARPHRRHGRRRHQRRAGAGRRARRHRGGRRQRHYRRSRRRGLPAHSLDNLPQLFEVSRRAMETAWQNIVLFAGVVNLVAVLCCATGNLGPIGAAFTHQLSSFLVMMNSLRLLRVERDGAGTLGEAVGRHLGRTPLPGLGRGCGPAASSRSAAMLSRTWWSGGANMRGRRLITAAALLCSTGSTCCGPDEIGVVERFGRKVLPYERTRAALQAALADRAADAHAGAHGCGWSRSASAPMLQDPDTEPAAYEWNVQHRSGRFQRKPEESLMLTGDQNMIELNATVHYRLGAARRFSVPPVRWRYDGARGGRIGACRRSPPRLRSTTFSPPGRKQMESARQEGIAGAARPYTSGVEVLRVKLQDVHPSLEVVDAFREVSGRLRREEPPDQRSRRISQRAGGAGARQRPGAAAKAPKAIRSAGRTAPTATPAASISKSRPSQHPGPTETRLYLETMEQVLPGQEETDCGHGQGPAAPVLLEDGVEIAPPAAPQSLAPPGPVRPGD